MLTSEPKEFIDKFIQIRVKSIEFHETDAIAIYFYDVTHHVESIKLTSEVKEHKSRYEHISNSQIILSHEFRTPLSSSLMMLEGLLMAY